MTSTNSKISFFIIYDWISSKGHGRELSKLLRQAGFVEARTAEEADILITHSAGYYLIPEQAKARFIVMIGPTLNSLSFANWLHANLENARMFWRDRKIAKGLRLNLLHIADIFLHPRHNMMIARAAHSAKILTIQAAETIIVANQADPWPHPENLNAYIENQPWVFMSMPGAHENVWEQPEEYVKLIGKHAERLLV